MMNKIVDLDVQKMQIGKFVKVLINYNLLKSVDIYKLFVDNLGVLVDGFKIICLDVYDKSYYRYVVVLE